jgi:hypothetical protein
MKKLKAFVLPIMLLALILVFFACNNLHTGEEDGTTGSFTISIMVGGNTRAMWDTWPDGNLSDGVAPSMLTHLITVTPKGGDPLTRVIEGSGSVSLTVPVGACTIVVEGMGPDHVVYSFGSRTVNIVPGKNPDAPISMGPRKMTAAGLTVLKNPVNPSYQGCAPDLTGIVVKINYQDGTSSITTDTTRFSTIPQRCEEWLSADAPVSDRTFTLYYRGAEGALVLPEVLGLLEAHVTGAGGFGDYYEDNLFEGIVLEGDYLSGTGIIRRRIPFFTDDAWLNLGPRTQHPTAIRIVDKAENKYIVYTVADNTNPSPLQPESAIAIVLPLDNYWLVDRLEYVSGSVTPFTVETVPKQDSVWLMALNDVKLRVIYYSPNNPPRTREIGMAEYRAAQNLRKASKIIITNSTGSSMTWEEMAIKPDINIYANLFYYSDLIDPDTGEPNLSVEPGQINAAMVPIKESFSYTFSGIQKVRRDETNHTGEPTVLGTAVAADTTGLARTAQELLDQLRKYWKVEAIYKSKVDPKAAPITVEYPADKWAVDGVTQGSTTNIGSVNGLPGMTGLDATNIQSEETRSVGIRFELPENKGWEIINFDYKVKP